MPTPTATIFLPYHALDDVILRGTRAAQPLASAVVAGTLYGVTDEGTLVERSNGTVWQAYSPTGGGGGAPAAHHLTHEPGGSDPLAVDAVAATGSLRTLGTGANQAAPGNDARFAAGTAAHHASHEPGGADALVNAAWTHVANVFTASPQQIGPMANPRLVFSDAASPADARVFRIMDAFQALYLDALNDAQTVVLGSPLVLTRPGDVAVGRDLYEKGRATPLGHWIDFTPSLSASAGTVTITAAVNYRYMLIGKTCWFSFYLLITLSSTPSTVTLALPPGIVNVAGYASMPFIASVGLGLAQVNPGSGTVELYRDFSLSAWPTGAQTIAGTLTLPIA